MSSDNTDNGQHEVRCLAAGCGRKLTAAKSVARGYGDRCWNKIRKAAEAVVLAGIGGRQAEKVRQLIADKGIVPTGRPGTYNAMSEDGQRTRICTGRGCTCEAGKRRRQVTCYHVLAARVLDLAKLPPAALLAIIAQAARPRRAIALPATTRTVHDLAA